MSGDRIHVFEKDSIPGGACDGYEYPGLGYVMRGGREMDNHFEVMWDLFRSIPSIETDNVSVLDEYYWLNKKDHQSRAEQLEWLYHMGVPEGEIEGLAGSV